MYRCCSIEPTVPVCVFLCVLPLFRIYQSTATCFTHSALVLLSSLYYSSVVLLWFCVLFSHSYENSNKTGLSFTFCRTQHTCRQTCTYLQTAVCRKVEVFYAYGTTKTRSALSLCVCEWIWQSANTSLTHFSIYKIDAALLCPLNSSHFSLSVPWHTHTQRETHLRPHLPVRLYPPTVRNQFTTRQRHKYSFCFAIKFDWCKRGSRRLARSDTRTHTYTWDYCMLASISLSLCLM